MNAAPKISGNFFENLPAISGFAKARIPRDFYPLPSTWSVLCTDVEASTKAVSDGRYRGVTMIGAACIIAAQNAAANVQLAYAFGGDGATICAPPEVSEAVINALLGMKLLALKEHQLSLRVGAVPAVDILAAGKDLLVAKVGSGGKISQALFSGGGLSYAENLIKAPNSPYLLVHSPNAKADLTGLECRWEDVRSSGETLSVIIEPLANAEQTELYAEIQQRLLEIFGSDSDCNPIQPQALKLSFRPAKLLGEILLKNPQLAPSLKRLRATLLAGKSLLGSQLIAICETLGVTIWSDYRNSVSQNTDFRKFVDGFKLVLRSTKFQREKLESYLEELWKNKRAVYGLHVSPGALITCLVINRVDSHFHFVDGDDGGLTMAARALKLRKFG